jgi:hypothetical protein
LLAAASLEAADLEWVFAGAGYAIRCGRIEASVRGSGLVAEQVELRPLLDEEAFFAADDHRQTRFQVVVPECRVEGLDYGELLRGTAYRARSIRFRAPLFEAVVNVDKPGRPWLSSPLMLHEALDRIREPLRVDQIAVTNARLTYGERKRAGAPPAVLTFGAVGLSVEGLANRGPATAFIQILGQGDLMDDGRLAIQLSLPVAPPDLSLHYSGSLTGMDLTKLNAFIETAESTRIKSGRAREATFDIAVNAGRARGSVRATYTGLQVAVLDAETGTRQGLNDRVASLLVNVLRVHNGRAPDAGGAMKEGTVEYTRAADDQFIEFLWSALWTGVRDVITH